MLDRIQAQGIAKKANIDNVMAAIEHACYQGKDYIEYLIPFQENVEELKHLYFTLTQIEGDKYEIAWGGY
jgi:hypothetical protein|nr:MAG TPA: hypothetical protein [Bacteriophage sp.]